jgi:hypothetical protein
MSTIFFNKFGIKLTQDFIQNYKLILLSALTIASIVSGFCSINPSAQESRFGNATAVNLLSDFTINSSSYTSQGSGEVIGEYLYTTAHNYTIDQINFLETSGAKFLSIKGQCMRKIVGQRMGYNEGVIKIPLNLLESQAAQNLGLATPTTLQNNPNINIINWYSEILNPNYIYVKGITKNQSGKKEQLLTGNQMFVSNGTGLSGGAYKYNSDLTTADNESKISYLLALHVGAANYQNQKINIIWVANGDGTFSYARYLQNGTVIRVDNLLNTECNL